MLQSRNLDDQTYEEIVEYAVSRLPWLCPQWTNHNVSDPGITILELMAWYKEMQQYHMNTFTDELRLKLLKLVGCRPRKESAAVCSIEPEGDGEYSRLTQLTTPEGVVFELAEGIPQKRLKVTGISVQTGENMTEVSELLGRPGLAIAPFSYGAGHKSQLVISLSGVGGKTFRLLFEVETDSGPERNPFGSDTRLPREICWSIDGAGEMSPTCDETRALSNSGYICFSVPEGCGEELTLRACLSDPGCEEDVRITDVRAGFFKARQTETWAATELETLRRNHRCAVHFDDELSKEAVFTVFVRDENGWRQETDFKRTVNGGRTSISLDGRSLANDGEPNLMAVRSDPVHYSDMYFNSDGQPGMTHSLQLDGRRVLRDTFTLICDTMCEDGEIRPQLWRCVDDLSSYSPRDRVFTYDQYAETLSFGNGEHGAIVPAGENAILIGGMELSRLSGGNVPAGRSLRFPDGAAAGNTEAAGGAEAETVADTSRRFLRELMKTEKCVCAKDYENVAVRTPGLRVAVAKAIPGFDPDEPTGRSDRPVITVVVIPYSEKDRPKPDARFLESVQTQMDRHRPICTVVRVTPPRYVPVSVTVQLKADRVLSRAELRRTVEDWLSVRDGGRDIGDPLLKSDLAMALQKLPGVLKLERVELRPVGSDCYASENGDVTIPRNAVAFLQSLDMDIG